MLPRKTASYLCFFLAGLFFSAGFSCQLLKGDPKPLPKPPAIDTASPQQIADAAGDAKKQLTIIGAGIIKAKDLTKAAPVLPELAKTFADMQAAKERAEKDMDVIVLANGKILANQAEIKQFITEAEAAHTAAVLSMQQQLDAKDKQIETLTKQLQAATDKNKALQDATNNWMLRLCWILGIAFLISGIVLRVQFPAFAQWCNGLMVGGVAALITGAIFRQILLWSVYLTWIAIAGMACVAGYILYRFARYQKSTVDELVEGIQAIKPLLTPEQLAAMSEKLTLVTSKWSQHSIQHVKAALGLGDFAKAKDSRTWWKRLLGIGAPTTEA